MRKKNKPCLSFPECQSRLKVDQNRKENTWPKNDPYVGKSDPFNTSYAHHSFNYSKYLHQLIIGLKRYYLMRGVLLLIELGIFFRLVENYSFAITVDNNVVPFVYVGLLMGRLSLVLISHQQKPLRVTGPLGNRLRSNLRSHPRWQWGRHGLKCPPSLTWPQEPRTWLPHFHMGLWKRRPCLASPQ